MTKQLTKDELTDLRNWCEGEFSDPRPTREMVRRVLGHIDALEESLSLHGQGRINAIREMHAAIDRAERAEENLIHAHDRAEKAEAIVATYDTELLSALAAQTGGTHENANG